MTKRSLAYKGRTLVRADADYLATGNYLVAK